MSYPQRFDSSLASKANNLPIYNYSEQLNPLQSQLCGGLPAQMFHPNQNPNQNPNPSIHPPNLFFPPIDFSVPPPNFPQLNVSINLHN